MRLIIAWFSFFFHSQLLGEVSSFLYMRILTKNSPPSLFRSMRVVLKTRTGAAPSTERTKTRRVRQGFHFLEKTPPRAGLVRCSRGRGAGGGVMRLQLRVRSQYAAGRRRLRRRSYLPCVNPQDEGEC